MEFNKKGLILTKQYKTSKSFKAVFKEAVCIYTTKTCRYPYGIYLHIEAKNSVINAGSAREAWRLALIKLPSIRKKYMRTVFNNLDI